MSSTPSPGRGFFGAVKNFFKANLIAGLLALTPLVATVFFMNFLIRQMDRILLLIPAPYRPENFLPFPIPGLGFIMLLAVLLLTGLVVRNFLGRKLIAIGDAIIARIPLISKLYGAVKQLLETIFNGAARDFKRVVLVEYPRKGVYALAFVTGMGKGELQRKTGANVVNLFVPTTPNPTSGFYLLVPEEDLIPLDMTVEDSFKVLISGGIISPEDDADGKAKRAHKEITQEAAR